MSRYTGRSGEEDMNTNRRRNRNKHRTPKHYDRRTLRTSNTHRKEQEQRGTSLSKERCAGSEKMSNNSDGCLSGKQKSKEQKC